MAVTTNPLASLAIKSALYLLPLLGVGYAGYHTGQSLADQGHQVAMAALQAQHAAELKQRAEDNAHTQAAASAEQKRLADLAHQVGWQLLQTRGELARSQAQLKERIADATQRDGAAFTGLGPDSLRLYRAALGYAESDSGLPSADAGNVAKADASGTASTGLPPADLLNHAADYGRWCQELETRLDSYIQLHQGAAHG
ncbi:hypothetical protein [Chromobacterium violaceum]|uniref:Uncharacterized protein n=1 Tax=Chromobacterium violaceum TaxID=536 RepID=A0AAX2M4L2_CHRVL|nr:hypothetical protein [Chromobacterium violaceum]MCD0491391.1 hypothetical protein [Chromobacterium violaceum]OLZ84656.1 hypothetical protein BS642_03660 [Chromobacterium violaceum]STB71628.1 Uncharacterised protein [Chromobacterium violaceum]SUX31387.1 Uncharacterised protein [Chromobacterium violaceum]